MSSVGEERQNYQPGMRLAAKPSPTDNLDAVAEYADAAEVYLEREHLDNLDESIESLKRSDLPVTTVHTTHEVVNENHPSSEEGVEYFQKADQMAYELGATLCVHSMHIPITCISDVEEKFDFDAEYAYENQAGAADKTVRSNVLDKGLNYIEDVAHTFVAEENYLDVIENRLNTFSDQIEAVHFNDSFPDDDGRSIGEGEMDMQETYRRIAQSDFDGDIVIEVPVEDQKDDLLEVRSWQDERLQMDEDDARKVA